MDQCRHDKLTVTVGVETETGNIVDVVCCANPSCDAEAGAIIADLRAQRDAAEKRAAEAEAEVKRQKAAVEKLIDELAGSDTCPLDWMGDKYDCRCDPCPAGKGDTKFIADCWLAWAYGEEVQDAKTD